MGNELAKRADPLLGRRGELLTMDSLLKACGVKVGVRPYVFKSWMDGRTLPYLHTYILT